MKFDPAWWNATISSLAGAHVLQTWEWATHKSDYGWEIYPYWWVRSNQEIHLCSPEHTRPGEIVGAIMLLKRPLRVFRMHLPVSVLYSSKGPLVIDWDDEVLTERILLDIASIGRKLGGIFVKIDPDVQVGKGVPGTDSEVEDSTGKQWEQQLQLLGWHFSGDQIQFRNTVQIPLQASEEELLAAMKQKTRYNIRLADRKGVEIRSATLDDLDMLFQMYAETANRDGFIIRPKKYYLDLWKMGLKSGIAEALIAEKDQTSIAGVVIFKFAQRAWYLYGMSRDLHRNAMPNYLLQWEAIRRIKSAGCKIYDLWGAPDKFVEDDPLWGVYRFKVGLGGETIRYAGAWDYPLEPGLYYIYTTLLPRILAGMRKLRRIQIRSRVRNASGKVLRRD